MLMGFDKFGMPEKPVLTLAYPQGIELGQIGNYVDFNFDPVFRSYSSISFKFPYLDETSDLYEKACNQMRIKSAELGEFIITKCEKENTGATRYKQITADSAEVQMCRRKINLLNGTYRFWGTTDTEKDESLLGKLICDYLPTWEIGYVSSDLKNKYRTFDVPDATLYDFLMNEVSESYECIFVFDTIGKKINAYTVEEAVHDSDIYVGYENFIKSEKNEEITDEITTVMSCYGGEGVNIASVNPLGSVFLYNFDHFKPMMSESLSYHLGKWETAIEDNKEQYAKYVTYIKENNRELIKLKADLKDLESMLAALEDVQAARVAHGESEHETNTSTVVFNKDNQISNADNLKYVILVAAIHAIKGESTGTSVTIQSPNSQGEPENIKPTSVTIVHPDNSKEIKSVNKNIADIQIAISDLENAISDVEVEKKRINDSLRLATGTKIGFTEADLLELDYFKFESTHQDENYIITDTMDFDRQQDMIQDFYDSCVALMKNVSAPTYNITADAINFLFVEKIASYIMKRYDPYKPETLKQLLGVKFHLEIAPDEWIEPVLLKFHVNFDDPSDFNMEFSNKYRLNSAIWTYADLIGDAVSSSGSMSFDYSSVKNWATHKDEMLDFINGNLDVSKNRLVNNSENNDFLIDNTGIRGSSTIKGGGDTNKGIWITSDTIAFTTDNWESARTAIGLIGNEGDYGVNAEVLIGKAILGNHLTISTAASDGDTVYMAMDGNGLTVKNNSRLIAINPQDGISILNKDNTKVFYTDIDGNIVLTGKITATGGEIAGFTIAKDTTTGIQMLKSSNSKIVLKSDGTATLGDLEITNGKANFKGTIYANQVITSQGTSLENNRGYLNPSVIQDGSIGTDHIASEAITANEIKANAITSGKINSGAVTYSKLGDDVVAEFNKIYATEAYVDELVADCIRTDDTITGTLKFTGGGKLYGIYENGATGAITIDSILTATSVLSAPTVTATSRLNASSDFYFKSHKIEAHPKNELPGNAIVLCYV